MKLRLTGLLAAVLLFAAACTKAQEAPSPNAASPRDAGSSLTGVTWVLTQESADALSSEAPPDARVDLTFNEDATANGVSACNNYSGAYTVDGESLSFGTMATTQMACDDAVSSLEIAYLQALSEVTGFRVSDDALTLSGSIDLVFTAEQPAAITGTSWHAIMINDFKNALASPLAGTDPTAEFADDGTIAGSDGCNRYHGTYTTDGNSISIGELGQTMMACEPDVAKQAQDFVTALQKARTFTIERDVLTLMTGEGTIAAGFTAEASTP